MLVALVLAGSGCRKSDSSGKHDVPPPKNTAEAATQLEQAFTTAPAQVRYTASTASEAMRSGNYEQAVAALTVIRNTGNPSAEQSTAIDNSSEALEQRLMAAMMAGDPNARRAYDLLKKMKRD